MERADSGAWTILTPSSSTNSIASPSSPYVIVRPPRAPLPHDEPHDSVATTGQAGALSTGLPDTNANIKAKMDEQVPVPSEPSSHPLLSSSIANYDGSQPTSSSLHILTNAPTSSDMSALPHPPQDKPTPFLKPTLDIQDNPPFDTFDTALPHTDQDPSTPAVGPATTTDSPKQPLPAPAEDDGVDERSHLLEARSHLPEVGECRHPHHPFRWKLVLSWPFVLPLVLVTTLAMAVAVLRRQQAAQEGQSRTVAQAVGGPGTLQAAY